MNLRKFMYGSMGFLSLIGFLGIITKNPVRCAVPAVIRKKRYYPEMHQKKSRWNVQKQCGIRQKKSVQKFWNGFRQ